MKSSIKHSCNCCKIPLNDCTNSPPSYDQFNHLPEYTVFDNNINNSNLSSEYKTTIGKKTIEKSDEKLGLYYHIVVETDTLAGLAIRYNTTVESLKRFNINLSDSSLISHHQIKIPMDSNTPIPSRLNPELLQRRENERLIKRFQIITKCLNPDEACFYMINAQYNLDKAVAKYVNDHEWERSTEKTIRKGKWSKY